MLRPMTDTRRCAVADSGDGRGREGLRAILLENRAQLIRFFTSRTGDAVEAEDVVQEIWLHLERAKTGPVVSPLSYLYRIGMNIVLDRARAGRRSGALDRVWAETTTRLIDGDSVDETPSAFDALADRERLARIARAIADLPPRAGLAFRRHRLDGHSHAEVAAELGISRSAVEKHIAVALRHLRIALDD